MPGHKEMKMKVKKAVGAKGSRAINQVVKKGVNTGRKMIKKKVMKDDRAKKISKAIPQPLKKLAKAKSRKAMKMLML